MTEERRNEKDGRRGMGWLFGSVRDISNWLTGGNGMAIPGEDWTAILPKGVKLEMVWVEPGTFKMGSDNHHDDEKPLHDVTLTKGYWIGKYQFTQGQWKAVGASKEDDCKYDGECLPVETVSWDEAMACCKKLNQLLGGKLPQGYRLGLPTEAQWEFAARGGVKSCGYKYSGDDDIDEVAWYEENTWDVTTKDVGQMKPNELGIYDMSGNVWEWCYDWYGDYPSRAVTDPAGPSSGLSRVDRGGSQLNDADYCRLTCRDQCSPDDCGLDLGFRVALVPVQ